MLGHVFDVGFLSRHVLYIIHSLAPVNMNFYPPPISVYNTQCVFSYTGLTVCVSGDTCTHTDDWVFFSRGIRRALPHIPLVIHECWSVFLCVHTYQCPLCSAAEGLRRASGEWVEGKVVVSRVRVGGHLWMPTTCLPWQGRTPWGPAPVRCLNRLGPYCPPPQLGAEHTTAAKRGSSIHPTNWMGTLWREGGLVWPGLVRSAHKCWCRSLNDAFKEGGWSAQWLGSR